MQVNNDEAFNSLKIKSDSESYDTKTGAVLVNGGIGVEKNISSRSVFTDYIHINKYAKIKKLVVDNNIYLNGEAKFTSLVPNTGDSYLGTTNEKIQEIYTNNLDTNNLNVNNKLISHKLHANELKIMNNSKIGINNNGKVLLNNDVFFEILIIHTIGSN